MASISRCSTGWRARYRTPEGASRSRTFGRKADAERFLTTVEASKLTGAFVDPSAGRTTFGDYAAGWAESRVHRASTTASLDVILRRHILPEFGSIPLAQVLPSRVQSAVKRWSKTLAPGTVNNVYRTTSAIFAAAIRDRLIAENPCAGVTLPRRPDAEIIPPSTEQVEILLSAMPDRYRVAGVLAAGAGLRQGEALGLTLDRIDFARRTLRVDRQMITPARGERDFGPPKSSDSVRTVPLGSWVLAEIGEHVQRHQVGSQELLVTYVDGRPVRRNRFGAMWRQSCARAALDSRYHDLRHYFASVLLASGCSVVAVQRALGHASAKVTLDTYGHLLPDAEEATRAAIDMAFARAAVSPACHETTG